MVPASHAPAARVATGPAVKKSPLILLQALLAVLALLALLVLPMAAAAGEIYGAITREGQALANEPISVACSEGATAPQGAAVTDAFGAYRLVIAGEGRCRIAVGGAAGAEVRIFGKPQRYNFELRAVGGKPQLVQR